MSSTYTQIKKLCSGETVLSRREIVPKICSSNNVGKINDILLDRKAFICCVKSREKKFNTLFRVQLDLIKFVKLFFAPQTNRVNYHDNIKFPHNTEKR